MGCSTEGEQLWQSLYMLSSGLEGVGFHKHDGPGAAAMIGWLGFRDLYSASVIPRRLPLHPQILLGLMRAAGA